MPIFNVIENYLAQQLAPATAAVLTGKQGCGKSQIAKYVAEGFEGHVLHVVVHYGQQLLVVNCAGSPCFDSGEQTAIPDFWAWFLAKTVSGNAPWLILIDNAHLLRCATTFVSTFYQLAEAGERSLSLLLVGQPFTAERKEMRRLCPVWVDVPAGVVPAGDEAQEVQLALRPVISRAVNPLRRLNVLRRTLNNIEESNDAVIGKALHRLAPSRGRFLLLGMGYAVLAGVLGWMMPSNLSAHLPMPWQEKKVEVVKAPQPKITDRPSGERSGMQGLISTWGYDVAPEMAWCDRIEAASLRCQSSTGTLSDLTRQALPWMASLQVDSRKMYAVVMRVGDNSLDLLVNQQLWVVNRKWFEHVWKGQYTLIVKTAPGGEQKITAKSTTEQVMWLDGSLSKVLNVPTIQATSWKPMLTEKVKLFQKQQNLPTDGIAGKATLIRLFQALGESPRLQVGEQPEGTTS
ncbi:peptidoglycan-binding protein [Trabulsiella odontotermitis]|uniref:peptidoglycan-binding protein n=1 Tax=Trabulsiella odontotermitis TaxID=379893 RepID=UPI0006BA4AF3|nr:peptidoglycan-binding protein [Trabulsiella odontotermitis]